MRGRSWKPRGKRDSIMKNTINHVKGLGVYCPRDIGKPSKDLKQRKDVIII